MDVFVRGRGLRITEQFRAKASQKLSKLERLTRTARVDIELSAERSPRLNGTKRIEGIVALPRHTIRASATAPDVDAALDLLVDRLERQVREHREKAAKRKKKLLPRGNPLKSPRTGPAGSHEGA